MYLPDITVDLTLSVSDLLIPNTFIWDAHKVRNLVTEEDALRILSIKPCSMREDRLCWAFKKDGSYSSQSGYRMLESLKPGRIELPPVEKKLWSNIWKIKTSPKIIHFIWRALAGALAVANQLRCRGIPVDRNCEQCSYGDETICHTLFNCSAAMDTWSAAGLPLPQQGLSQNSVFLDIYHLLSCIKSKACPSKLKQSIPWILWNIWKARNALVFEKIRWDPVSILRKAEEEAAEWYDANNHEDQVSKDKPENCQQKVVWVAPPKDMLKCNIGVSWSAENQRCGVSWVVRDSRGKVLMHSRGAYFTVPDLKSAELLATLWAVECLSTKRRYNIIFESCFLMARTSLLDSSQYTEGGSLVWQIMGFLRSFNNWSMEYALLDRTKVAMTIAESVISDGRYQSYIANAGPSWLHTLITMEAETVLPNA